MHFALRKRHSHSSVQCSVFTSPPPCPQPQEWSIDKNSWVEDFYAPPFEVRDGKVAISDRPGWGITPDSSALSSAVRTVSRLSIVG